MSYTERNKGRLFPIDNSTLTEEQKEDPWDHGLLDINGVLYRVEYEIERDDVLDFAEVTVNPDGTVDFHTMHYNGGGSLSEVIKSRL
jgi:hypothetical protein